MTGIIVTTPPTVELPPGSTSGGSAVLPGVTYTYAVLSLPQTWTAKQTFPLGNISIQAADIVGLPSAVPGGSATQVQYNNSGAFAGISGATTDGTTLTLVAPILGTPASITLTNGTGLPVSTGVSGLATGVATFLATPSSANLRAALTDEVGTGAAYFVGGALGTPASGTLTSCTAFTLTTTGSSGAATYSAGTLNIPNYTGGGGVTSIASNTGAFTLAGGITNSTNQIQLDGNYTGWAIPNCSIAASVASNILTVALKDNAGNDPSATSPVFINYRSATAATGTTTLVSQTAALSITTNATGATLGSSNATAFRFWVVSFNNAGTNVLALINCSTSTRIFPLDETQVASSTPISGSATSAGVFYTPNGTTITSKAFRILGYVEYNATGLATAGTYASGPNFIQTFGAGIRKPGEPVQVLYNSTTSSSSSTSSTLAASNNTLTITPTSAVNLIKIHASTVGLSASASAIESVIRRGTSTNIGSTATLSPLAGGGQRNVLANLAVDKPNTASSQAYTVYFLSSDNSSSVSYISTGVTTGSASMVVEELMG